MTVFDLIEQAKSSFTSTDNVIYNLCKRFPEKAANESVTSITEYCGVSKAALTRFAKKLGFSGFNEFQYQFRLELNSASEAKKAPQSVQYVQVMQNVESSVDEQAYQLLAEKILDAEFVYYSGRYLSRIPAYFINAQTSIYHWTDSRYVHSDELYSTLNENSLVMLFSVSSGGNYSYVLEKYAARTNPPYRVLVTLSANHPLAGYFDQVIVLPGLNSPQYSGSTLPETLSFLMFAEILKDYVNEEKMKREKARE